MAAAFLVAACNSKLEEIPDPETPETPEIPQTFQLDLELASLEGNASWNLPEKVNAFWEGGSSAVLSRGADGTYTSSRELLTAPKWVFSPADVAAYSSGSLAVQFPSIQYAEEGTVPAASAFGMGSCQSNTVTLQPLVSGVVFRFERTDVYAVTLRGLEGEPLCGVMQVDPAQYSIHVPESGGKEVRLVAPIGLLEEGKNWVMALPPVSFHSGVSLTVETLDGTYEFRAESPMRLNRGSFYTLTVPDQLLPPVVSIPDQGFKAWLLERFDANQDGEIGLEEALQVTSIDLSTEEIYSLEGIGAFTNLKSLTAKGRRDENRNILGKLTGLDLSGLSQLEYLDCRHNHIVQLVLADNTSLREIVTYGNSLTSLDLSGAPNLTSVDAGDCAIGQVNVRENSLLRTLYVHNNRIQEADFSACYRLESLSIDRNLLRTLDLGSCAALTSLDCSPMNSDGGQNLLESVTLPYGIIIEGVTVNRSADRIPSATSILWVNAPEPPQTPGTGLRTIRINTPGGVGINSKDFWTDGCTVKLLDDAGTVYYESNLVSVKGRGNSTWNYDKKPYTLKLPAKANLIGTGADKRWVLLANWMDRTLLRNDVAFELARRTSLDWTPSGEFVELYLDDHHMGNYWLGEKIKTGSARVQASFIIEMDTYYDATWRFYSTYGRRVNQGQNGLPIGVKEPDDDQMTQALFTQIKSLVSDVERSLYEGVGNYNDKLDATSFADWFLVHEVTYNGEPNHPKSCYFHFRNDIMYAGPVWDFDWYTFQENTSGLFISNSIYFEKLLQDAAFVSLLKSRWTLLKPSFQDVTNYIDQKAAQLKASDAINAQMWPCTSGINGDDYLSFDAAIARMKRAVDKRIKAIDTALNAL